MKHLYYWFFLCLFSFSLFGQKRSFDLSEAQALALKKSANLANLKKTTDSIEHKVNSIDKAYNLNLNNQNTYTYDESANNQILQVDSSEQFFSSVELSKLFTTGTSGKFKASVLRLENKYSPDNPSSLSAFEVPNSYETKLEFEASQALLRNWMSREITLQKNIARAGSIETDYQQRVLAQTLSYEMENLFIALSSLEKQIRLLKNMKHDLERVTDLTKNQFKYGRAEELNVVKSEYKIVAFEMRLHELMNKKSEIRKKILIKCGFYKNFDSFDLQPISLKSPSVVAALDSYAKAYQLALQNRQDLQKLQKLEEPIYGEINLMKEKDRPNLNVFLNFGVNGKKQNFSDAWNQMIDFNHPRVTVGVNFSMTFGAEAYQSENLSYMNRIEALGEQRKSLLETLQEDLELTYDQLQLIDKKIKLNELKTKVLKKQYELEKIKFAQAREERLSLVLTQIEAKELSIEALALRQEKLQMMAKLKFLTHSYEV